MAALHVLTDADVKVLRALINSTKKDRQDTGGRRDEKLWVEGDDQNSPDVYIALPPADGIPALTLAGSIPAAGDTPGYADCEIFRIIHNYPSDPTLEAMDVADKRVYNLTTEDIPGETAWIVIYRTKTGEWVTPGSISPIRHCRVTECLGYGYYRAEFALPIEFAIPEDQTVGTSTSTAENATCDPCDLIVGEGPGTSTDPDAVVTCGTLTEPVRIVPTGSGSIIIYDPRAIPLKIPGHAIIADVGNLAPPETTGTGTGTGTSPTEKIYMVLTGTYEVVGIPDRFYTCCEGVGGSREVVLTQCDTYIVEGAKCAGTPIDCPTTGTA